MKKKRKKPSRAEVEALVAEERAFNAKMRGQDDTRRGLDKTWASDHKNMKDVDARTSRMFGKKVENHMRSMNHEDI